MADAGRAAFPCQSVQPVPMPGGARISRRGIEAATPDGVVDGGGTALDQHVLAPLPAIEAVGHACHALSASDDGESIGQVQLHTSLVFREAAGRIVLKARCKSSTADSSAYDVTEHIGSAISTRGGSSTGERSGDWSYTFSGLA